MSFRQWARVTCAVPFSYKYLSGAGKETLSLVCVFILFSLQHSILDL